MIDYSNLPDVMYFGAPKQVDELKNRVFLTPHMGIASLFIIDKNDILRFTERYSFNIGYRQWGFANEKLKVPLRTVNMLHNIADLEDKVYTGRSSGYIYEVDISNVKDRLSLFVTNDPDREVIYNGEEPLAIVRGISHSLRWDFSFDPEEVIKHGAAQRSRRE